MSSITSPRANRTARSMVFRNSRTFPGQPIRLIDRIRHMDAQQNEQARANLPGYPVGRPPGGVFPDGFPLDDLHPGLLDTLDQGNHTRCSSSQETRRDRAMPR